jgi:C-terminal processing protease CtpA/Prc
MSGNTEWVARKTGTCGLGMMLNFDPEQNEFVITALAKGGAAEASGCLVVGDSVLRIDGYPLVGLTPEQVVEKVLYLCPHPTTHSRV